MILEFKTKAALALKVLLLLATEQNLHVGAKIPYEILLLCHSSILATSSLLPGYLWILLHIEV